MKVLSAAILSVAFAQGEKEPRRFNAISRMAYGQVTTDFSAKEFGKRIQNYGCHCFPGFTKEAGGSGAPVNAVDGLCKTLSRCHKCVAIDFPGMIDVNTGKYNWENVGPGNIDCSGNKNNPARKALCECDAAFAMAMGTTWNDSDFDTFYWLAGQNSDPTFDQASTCSSTTGAGGAGNADQCCGASYPLKEPYDSTVKSCCGGSVLFNHVLMECCDNGDVAAIGSC